jgi:hypothetical protein
MVLRVLGLVLALALAAGLWFAYDSYGQFANVARWTGDSDLRWLRAWLVEFRMPVLCVVGFLVVSGLSWLWSKLGLGH